MALLDWKRSPLVRLKARDWTDDDERKELFRLVTARTDIKLKDILWTLTAPEVEVRQLGGLLLPRFAGDGLAEALLEDLNDKTHAQQRLLIRHISRCEPGDVLEIASRLLQDTDKNRRALGIELVNALPLARAMSLVKDLLRDPSADVRVAALSKLLEDPRILEDKAMRQAVVAMASDRDERIRMSVVRTVAQSPSRNPVMQSLLVRAMRDDSYNIQQLAAQTLGERIRSGDPELEAALIELLADGSTSVRTAVVKALLQAPDRSRVIRRYLTYARSLAGWVRERALESLKTFSRDLIEPIIELMHDENKEIRLLALGVGSVFEDPRCVPSIIELLNNDDWWTRVTAAETLGRIGDKRAMQPLIALLADEEARWTVIEALGHIGDPAAVSALSPYLKDPAVEIRLATLEALASIGLRDVIPAIEWRARHDESRAVRDRALELVRRLEAAERTGRDLEELEAVARQIQASEQYSELEQLMIEVRNRGGSDLHLTPSLPPLYRVHGELQRFDAEPLEPARIEQMVQRLLTDAQREELAVRQQVDFCYTIPNVGRYRCNVFVQRLGLGGIFRVIPGLIPTFQDIGMPLHMADLVNYHQGLIVVAGPSGSGKSTTLAALVNLFNENKRAHIITLEDPVEFVHPIKNCLVNQREVGKHTQSFANALRAALREDPDIIVIGEMRELETMKIAIEAAETGHLVIGTLNTTTAAKTVDRMIESFPPAEQPQVRMTLAESIKAVVCQNLMPRRDGRGRVALYEILLGSPSVRAMIRDNKTFQLLSAMQIGRSQGMRTVDMSLMELVQQRHISADMAYLRAQDKKLFEPMVSPAFLREVVGDFELPEKPRETSRGA